MIEGVNLDFWLTERSASVETRGAEVIYTHATGEKSVLVKRESWRDDMLQLTNPMLTDFYAEYLGASIGGSLIIATIVEGGLTLSLGYRLFDLDKLKSTASNLGICPQPNEDLFMMGYAGTFFYGYENTGEKVHLRRHDRDYKCSDEDMSFLDVINNWWEICTESK
jgi:hypothetical protein